MTNIYLALRALFLSAVALIALFLPAAIILVVAALLGPGARAAEIEIGALYTHFRIHSDSVWRQEAWGPYEIQRDLPGLYAGVRGDLWSRGQIKVGYSVGAMYLGKHRTYCECTASDAIYFEYRDRGGPKTGPTSIFTTQGTTYGYHASAVLSYGRLFGEAGIARLSTNNKVRVANLPDGWTPDGTFSGDNGRTWYNSPRFALGWRVNDNLSVAASTVVVDAQRGQWYPVIKGRAYSIEARYAF